MDGGTTDGTLQLLGYLAIRIHCPTFQTSVLRTGQFVLSQAVGQLRSRIAWDRAGRFDIS